MDMLIGFFKSVPYFVILIGLLVFIHEAGHFLFAKLFKVKIHVFSLGFGPKLFGFQKGETFYKVSALPLGGYVKMLGEDPSEEIGPSDKGRAFTDKPAWQRFIIIIGGPVMNILFPLFLHFGVGLTFTQVMPAEVGFVLQDMPAWKAGVRPGDVIETIDGEAVRSFEDVVSLVSPSPGRAVRLGVRRDGQRMEMTVVPQPTEIPIVLNEKETVGRIGVAPDYLPTVIGVASTRSPAGMAGLTSFDLIETVDGKPVTRLMDLERRLVAKAGAKAALTVKRFKEGATPPFLPFEAQFENRVRAVTLDIPVGVHTLADLGIESTADFVVHVTPGGVAEKAGMKRGDKVVALDGRSLGLSQIFNEFERSPDKTFALAWTRDGKRFEGPFKQKFIPAGEAKDLGIKRDVYDKGFWGWLGRAISPTLVANPGLVTGAVRYALKETWAGVKLIGIGFKLLFSGEISLRSIGGPLMIGQLAGQAGQMGASSFFWVMALISLNLGMINLLPIPMLDGGQIVLVAIEAITNRPISRAIKEKVALVGVAMLLLLMVFATWNDIARLVLG